MNKNPVSYLRLDLTVQFGSGLWDDPKLVALACTWLTRNGFEPNTPNTYAILHAAKVTRNRRAAPTLVIALPFFR
ncbi:hypothetical protein [Anthocerotibacter panamensis]|uniref:hypothetical protein n=1 Tax=Anthocerotibacter panamensis TaxID=2857077 RepID=UPI001C407C42|nr:hypothetical protein [Anthocerotibacter panamensis]